MFEIVFIASVILIVFGVVCLADSRARKSNQKWLHLKALTLQRLEEYAGENREFVEEQVSRFSHICETIARSGILDSKRNQILAQHALLTLEMLEAFGFVKDSESEDART